VNSEVYRRAGETFSSSCSFHLCSLYLVVLHNTDLGIFKTSLGKVVSLSLLKSQMLGTHHKIPVTSISTQDVTTTNVSTQLMNTVHVLPYIAVQRTSLVRTVQLYSR
jgi:hypothetical protein